MPQAWQGRGCSQRPPHRGGLAPGHRAHSRCRPALSFQHHAHMPPIAATHRLLLPSRPRSLLQADGLLWFTLVVRLGGPGPNERLRLPLRRRRGRLRPRLLPLLLQYLLRRPARQRRAVLPLRAGRAHRVALQVPRQRVLRDDRRQQHEHLVGRLHLPAGQREATTWPADQFTGHCDCSNALGGGEGLCALMQPDGACARPDAGMARRVCTGPADALFPQPTQHATHPSCCMSSLSCR